MGERDANDFGRFSGGAETLLEGNEVRFVTACHAGDDEQDFAHRCSSAAHGTLALVLARVVGYGGYAGQFGDGFAGECADLGHLCHETGDGAVGNALDGAEVAIQMLPEWIFCDELSDVLFEGLDLLLEEREQLVEGGQHDGVCDEAALVELRGADLGELAEAGDEGAAVLLVGRGRGSGSGMFDLGEVGDEGCVDGVCFLKRAHALCELADGAWVEDGDGEMLLGEQQEGLLFVAAGGFHGDQFDVVLLAEGGQMLDAFRVVGENGLCAARADGGLQGAGSNIDSTNDSCHGNLPCKCD